MNYTELRGDESNMSDWLKGNTTIQTSSTGKNKFVVYPLLKCNCIIKSTMNTTDDGNRHQWCNTCKWSWKAPA